MTAGRPYTLKGISPEARQAAKLAAERRGQPVGRWVNDAILKVAQEEAEGQLPVPLEADVRQLAVRLEEVAGVVEELRRRTEGSPMTTVRKAWRGLLVRLTPEP